MNLPSHASVVQGVLCYVRVLCLFHELLSKNAVDALSHSNLVCCEERNHLQNHHNILVQKSYMSILSY